MQFASYNLGGGYDDGYGKGKGKGDDCCNDPAWYAAYELTVLRPYTSNITLGPGLRRRRRVRTPIHRRGGTADARMGARFRYWFYNHGHDFVPNAPVTLNMDLDVADLEATLNSDMHNWNLMVSGGARYGRLGYNLGPSTVFFEGAGLTGSVEATRCIGSRGFNIVGNFRGSLLGGEIQNPAGVVAGPPTIDDELMTILESQMGLGWTRELRSVELHLRAVVEMQFWLNDTFADSIVGIGSNQGLLGGTFGAEVRY